MVEFKCDSCFVYVREDYQLVLRASKNPRPEAVDQLKIPIDQGITGSVAEHREAVAMTRNACEDPRFEPFGELPEDYVANCGGVKAASTSN